MGSPSGGEDIRYSMLYTREFFVQLSAAFEWLHDGILAHAFPWGRCRPKCIDGISPTLERAPLAFWNTRFSGMMVVVYERIDFLSCSWRVGVCEHRRRVIPYHTPNTWSAPKRWLVCTKDRFWSSLPKGPAHSRPSSHPHPNTCRRLSSSRSMWCSTLTVSRYTTLRRGRIAQLEYLWPREGGYQPDITPRGYMNRQLAPRTHLFPHLVRCLSHVGTTIYIAVSERAQMSRHAGLLSAQRRATVKPCLYNHLVYHRLEIPIRSKKPLRKRPRCLVLGLDPPWGIST